MAPIIEARTISRSPERNATVAMISSGRLPLKGGVQQPPDGGAGTRSDMLGPLDDQTRCRYDGYRSGKEHQSR